MSSDDEIYDEELSEELYDEDDVYYDEDPNHEELIEDGKPSDAQSYTILSAADIKKRQEDAISQVSALLSLSKLESRILLHHYDWNVNNAQEMWFAKENDARTAAGLPVVEPVKPLKKRTKCMICFEEKSPKTMAAAACGHRYCVKCWKGYFESAINEGSGCLSLRCPEPSCKAAVALDMFNAGLVRKEVREKYYHYLLFSYVEQNQYRKWCPAPDCEFYVEIDGGSEKCDVECKCLHGFCWNCAEDSHRPVDCDTVAKWVMKNSSEAENTQWILSYTKPCPKCKKPIEKNSGCNHMTCRAPCRHEFCWTCLASWNKHSYSCNGYPTELQESKSLRDRAMQSLERYTHYYERWASNNRSKLQALDEIRNLELKTQVLKDNMKHMGSTLDVGFIMEAWKQIFEGRRVLQWTYAYGYYNIEGEKKHKKDFFEHVQGITESALEQLHHCAEQENRDYFVKGGNMDGLFDYRHKLINHTKAVREYFGNLVQALETSVQDAVPVQTSVQDAAICAVKSLKNEFINFVMGMLV